MIRGSEITASFATKPLNPTKKTGRQERVMRQMVSGLIAAAAVMTVSAAPASACGGLGLVNSGSPGGQAYVSPCAQSYAPVAPVLNFASGCGGCGGGYGYAGYERLPELS